MRIGNPRMMTSVASLWILLVMCAVPSNAQEPGDQVYKAKCASCHGADGKGKTPVGKALGVNDFSTTIQPLSDQELVDIISKGKNKMPAYGKSLKESDIKDLVTYVRGLAKK